MAVAGDELHTVVAGELPRCAVFGYGGFHGTPGGEGGQSAGGGRGDGEAGVLAPSTFVASSPSAASLKGRS